MRLKQICAVTSIKTWRRLSEHDDVIRDTSPWLTILVKPPSVLDSAIWLVCC